MKNNSCPTSCTKTCAEYELWIGLFVFLVGAVFLLMKFDVIGPEFWSYFWPSVLVISGLKLILMGGAHSAACDCVEPMPETTASEPKTKKSSPKKKASSKKPKKK